ncbi:hypothetical protein EXIGLDRAFT_3865 [Exidia glandulosa HHB12029]|uniref:Uncharacterized protein n=1 Tax=Exidia glandulosa HHB12029 TaxID=1314781 RepID=A0A165QLV0_EXIGL|nr:hypothetical protein EXIGLDRAFT_3865 [Exidia glandulosa HHB12029]
MIPSHARGRESQGDHAMSGQDVLSGVRDVGAFTRRKSIDDPRLPCQTLAKFPLGTATVLSPPHSFVSLPFHADPAVVLGSHRGPEIYCEAGSTLRELASSSGRSSLVAALHRVLVCKCKQLRLVDEARIGRVASHSDTWDRGLRAGRTWLCVVARAELPFQTRA